MSKLSDEFASGKFSVTCELNPPKGVNLDPLYQKAESLKGVVSAFNLTDSAGSSMAMAPIEWLVYCRIEEWKQYCKSQVGIVTRWLCSLNCSRLQLLA